MASMNTIERNEIGSDCENLEKLQNSLYHYCMSLTKSRWDAEDLAQDTWLKAIGKLSLGHANPEALLLRIAKNTWIDQSRRKMTLARIAKNELPNVTLPDSGSIEIEMALLALKRHLPPLQRTVFLLRDVWGYSIVEASEILNTTEGAIKAALHRARKSLDAVKDDLESGKLSLSEEDEAKASMRTLVAAYQSGDLETLIASSLQSEVDPIAVIGIVQNRLLRTGLSVRGTELTRHSFTVQSADKQSSVRMAMAA